MPVALDHGRDGDVRLPECAGSVAHGREVELKSLFINIAIIADLAPLVF
jgi:hypothetical protein